MTNTPDQIDQILNNLTEQTSLRMMNMKLAPEVTAAQILELEAQAHAALKLLLLKARKEELECLIDLDDDSKSLPFGNSLFTNHSVIGDRIKALEEEMKG